MHSHGRAYPEWGFGQQEVTNFNRTNAEDLWRVQPVSAAVPSAYVVRGAGYNAANGVYTLCRDETPTELKGQPNAIRLGLWTPDVQSE